MVVSKKRRVKKARGARLGPEFPGPVRTNGPRKKLQKGAMSDLNADGCAQIFYHVSTIPAADNLPPSRPRSDRWCGRIIRGRDFESVAN